MPDGSFYLLINCRHRFLENLHLSREVHTHHAEKLNLSSRMYGDCVVGPCFVPRNQDNVDLALTEVPIRNDS